MSTSSEDDPEFITTDDAFALITERLGITTWKSFQVWRQVHRVRTLKVVRFDEFMAALGESKTRGEWRRHQRDSSPKIQGDGS